MASAKKIGFIDPAILRDQKNKARAAVRAKKFGKPLGVSLGDALRKAGI